MKTNYQVFSEPELAFNDIFVELEKATKSIYIESFLLDDDSIGQRLIDILKEKAKLIPVTVLIDDYGFKNPSKKMLQDLFDSKIEFSLFNPIRQVIRTGKFFRWFQDMRVRNHRKLTLIDNTLAYVGGMNYSAKELDWRDVMVKITGRLIADLQLAAKEMKNIHYNHQWLHRSIEKSLTKKPNICRQIPYSNHRPLHKKLKRIIQQAKKEVLITTPYFVPDIQFLHTLRKAIKKKIKVILLVPKKSDHYFADILTDFFIRVAHQIGIKVHILDKVSHAKYLIVDEASCTFGSANFDQQAFYKNYELNIFSKNKKLITDLRNVFTNDLNNSKPFTPLLKRNKNLYRRTMEKILYRVRDQF